MVSVHRRLVSALEAKGALDRELEALPGDAEFGEMEKAGLGLTSPELATLLAHVKLDLRTRSWPASCRTPRCSVAGPPSTSRRRCGSSTAPRSTRTRCCGRSP